MADVDEAEIKVGELENEPVFMSIEDYTQLFEETQ